MLSRFRSIGLVMILACLAVTVGCGGDSTAPQDPVKANAGIYNLQTVNGIPLPATLLNDGSTIVAVTSGTLSLRTDQSYTETLGYRTTYLGVVSNDVAVENGTFDIVGSTITFTIPAQNGEVAQSYTGAVQGGNLTYTFGDSFNVKYKRQ
jgi:hypothetical protein